MLQCTGFFVLCVAAFIALFFPFVAQGAGLWLYEFATPDMGTASAGRAALAKDASTASINPAGMTRLKRPQLLFGLQPFVVKSEFDPDAGTTIPGGDGGDAGDTFFAGSLSYAHPITERIWAGIGLGSYFGLGVKYDDSWAGRYFVQEGEFVTVGANPGVAFRVNDWLSVGAGFSVIYATLYQRSAVNNSITDPGYPDGKIKVEDEDVGFGGNFGVLFELGERTRIGATYRSEVEFEFEDVAELSGLGPNLNALLSFLGVIGSKVDLKMTLPQGVMVSGYHEFTDALALMANVGWQDWSEFGQTSVSLRSTTERNVTSDRNFDDTWHFALGAQYRVTEPVLLSLGFAYDTSPVDDTDRTPDMPLDRQIRYGAGIQYDLNDDMTVGAAYEFLDAGEAKINQTRPAAGTLSGEYASNYIHFFNANLAWKF